MVRRAFAVVFPLVACLVAEYAAAIGGFCPRRVTDHVSAQQPFIERGAGGYGVVWRECSGDTCALAYARLSLDGDIVAGPVTVTSGATNATGAVLRWSGLDWGLLWYQKLGEERWALFFQRLDADGAILSGPVRLNVVSMAYPNANARNRGLAWDGIGWGVVWKGYNTRDDVFYAHLSAEGVLDVPEAGVADTDPSVNVVEPMIGFNGATHGVVWQAGTGVGAVFRYLRLSPGGVPAGPSVPVTGPLTSRGYPDLVWNGSEYGLAWTDARDDQSESAVYFTRFAADGTVLSAETRLNDPWVKNTNSCYSIDLFLAFAGDRWVVVYEDSRTRTGHVFGIGLSAAALDGSKLGDDASVSDLATKTPDFPAVAWDGGTRLLTLWHAAHGSDTNPQSPSLEIVAQLTDRVGDETGFGIFYLTSAHAPALQPRFAVSMASTGTGTAVAWMDQNANVWLRHVALDGTPGWQHQVVSAASLAAPQVAVSPTRIAVLWRLSSAEVRLTRYSLAGVGIGETGIVTNTNQPELSIIWSGSAFILAWPESRDGNYEIVTTAVAEDGSVLTPSGNRISTAAGHSRYPSLAGDDTARLVAWSDTRDGNWETYAARLTDTGELDGAEIRVTDDAGIQLRPSVAWSGTSFLVVWQDNRSGLYRVMGRLIQTGASFSEIEVSMWPGNSADAVWQDGVWKVAYYSSTSAALGVAIATLASDGTKSGDDDLVVNGGWSPAIIRWTEGNAALAWVEGAYFDSAVWLSSLVCLYDGPAPLCPTGLVVDRKPTGTTLGWTPAADSYRRLNAIYRDQTRIAVVPAATSLFEDVRPSPDSHMYEVRTVLWNGSESTGCSQVPSVGVTVNPKWATTSERASMSSFWVSLGAAPTANVIIDVTSSDLTEGTVSPATLVFTPSDWSTPRVVTVTGVDDEDEDGDVYFKILLSDVVSSDPNYSGLEVADVRAVNADDEPCHVVLADQTVTSEVTFTSCGWIKAGPNWRVGAAGNVTLRAKQWVALGNGVSVGTGGRLRVQIVPSL